MAKALLSRSGMHMCHLSMTLVLTWIEFVTGKKEITDSVCCTLIHLELLTKRTLQEIATDDDAPE